MVVGNSFGKHMGRLNEQEVKVNALHLISVFDIGATELLSKQGCSGGG